MNNNIIIAILVGLAGGYFIRKIPGIFTIGIIIVVLYAVQVGSGGQLPLINDLVNGVQVLMSKQRFIKM